MSLLNGSVDPSIHVGANVHWNTLSQPYKITVVSGLEYLAFVGVFPTRSSATHVICLFSYLWHAGFVYVSRCTQMLPM